ncbi:MAG TPA: hypothetical protein VM686_33795, partial [Polyangiaceae bacterium]|nr:hypothetical protein [Polyangiaceae bacterium]
PPPPKEHHWSATLGMHVSAGFAPKASPGIGATLAYAKPPVRLVARGAVFAPTEDTLENNHAVGAEFSLGGISLAACAGDDLGAAEAWLCGGGRLYRLSAHGFGTDANFTEDTYVGAPIVGFDLGLHLTTNVMLLTGIEGGYAPASSRFVIQNAGTVHETEHVFGEARLEIGVRF